MTLSPREFGEGLTSTRYEMLPLSVPEALEVTVNQDGAYSTLQEQPGWVVILIVPVPPAAPVKLLFSVGSSEKVQLGLLVLDGDGEGVGVGAGVPKEVFPP